MHELRARATDSAPDGLGISETWDRRGVLDAELAFSRYRLFWKDRVDGRKGGGVTTMVKETIPAVFHPLTDIVINDVATCGIGLWNLV